MGKIERGSTWKKCDLHFHTPKSYDYRNKTASTELLVDTLIENEVKLVAVTDHHVISTEIISGMRRYANNRLTILPGVELRSDLGDNVHFVLIFSEEKDLQQLSIDIQSYTNIYENTTERSKFEQCIISKDKIKEIAEKHNALVSVHAGNKHNSIETIKNNEPYLIASKIKALETLVHMLEVSNEKGVSDYKTKVFPNINFSLPIVTGSDNHDISDYKQEMDLWINCDATFRGLQQAVIERQERISIGERPTILSRIKSKPHTFIDNISIKRNNTCRLKEIWFDNIEIPINPGLTCIIGNKGNGKSALSDIIAVLTKSKINHHDYSFLNEHKFCDPKNCKARHFNASITYLSDTKDTIDGLDKKPLTTDTEKAAYIPQRYLETICNDIGQGSEFQTALKRVIFSHIPKTNKHGKETLDELISFKTSEIELNIVNHKTKLQRQCKTLNDLISKSSDEQKITTSIQLDNLLRNYRSICKSRPAPVPVPNNTEDEKAKSITKSIEELSQQKKTLENARDTLEKTVSTKNTQTEELKRIQERLIRLNGILTEYRSEIESLCTKAEFPFSDISIPDVEYDKLTQEITRRESELARLQTPLSKDNEEGYPSKIETLVQNIKELSDQLAAPQKAYQKYQEQLILWRESMRQLLGDNKTPDTIRYLLNRIKEIHDAPRAISEVCRNITSCGTDIFKEIASLKREFDILNEPIQRSISQSTVIKDHNLIFSTDYNYSDLQQTFFDLLNHAKAGSFYSTESAQHVFDDIVSQFSIETTDNALELVRELILSLSFDMRQGSEFTPRNPTAQLKTGLTLADVLYTLYSFDYIRPNYRLNWGNKPLDQLSPGERGTLLLVFFLILDINDKPLIIDQPEDNLDNHTIYKTLVPCIKEAKKRRQIIIVTHNPNIAVVCDSDQIIHTSIDKQKGNRVNISSGSIENPNINKAIVDILEGTYPAFTKRDQKYFNKDN